MRPRVLQALFLAAAFVAVVFVAWMFVKAGVVLGVWLETAIKGVGQ